MAARPDPYTVLRVAPSASAATIRRAYRALARASHPDVVGDQGLGPMQRLNAAWDILRDPDRRAAFDATRAVASVAVTQDAPPARGPDWTGAAGPPPGRPSGTRVDFGLYAGWTLGEIARHDHGYLAWLLDRREGSALADEIKTILDRMRSQATESQGKNGFWRR